MKKGKVEKTLNHQDYQNIMRRCLEAWSSLEHIKVILKDISLEGVKAKDIKNSIKCTEDTIKEIYTCLFSIDEDRAKNK